MVFLQSKLTLAKKPTSAKEIQSFFVENNGEGRIRVYKGTGPTDLVYINDFKTPYSFNDKSFAQIDFNNFDTDECPTAEDLSGAAINYSQKTGFNQLFGAVFTFGAIAGCILTASQGLGDEFNELTGNFLSGSLAIGGVGSYLLDYSQRFTNKMKVLGYSGNLLPSEIKPHNKII